MDRSDSLARVYLTLAAVTALALTAVVLRYLPATAEPGGCSSGVQVDLGGATTGYVPNPDGTLSSGWGRHDDLIDEQANPTPWNAWEPGYPDTVSVEVTWAQPVDVGEIRLARDWNATAGSVTVASPSLAGPVSIDVTGVRDWVSAPVSAPAMTSLTITRSDAASNVAELVLCAGDATDGTTTTTTDTAPTTVVTTTTTPVVTGADPHGATVGVVDSFGETTPWNHLGISKSTWEQSRPASWNAIDSYYEDFGFAGQCSSDEHAAYWTQAADGNLYPSWHPHLGADGCEMGHEHGDDPRTSDIYTFSQGLPFGYANEVYSSAVPEAMRHEDHVGQKVTVKSDWTASFGNPANTNDTLSPVAGVQCDWLSKIHQGSSTADALRMNMHEYFLNLSCNGRSGSGDGADRAIGATAVRVKELIHFGEPGVIWPCDGASGTVNTGGTYHPTAQLRAPYINDGKREIACDNFWQMMAGNSRDLWKPDGIIKVPQQDGTTGLLAFSPYYVVKNPARIVRGSEVMYTIDLCFNSDGSLRAEGPICPNLSQALIDTPAADRWKHPDSPFDGTNRAVHPKSIPVWNDNGLANGPDGSTIFCTDAMGEQSVPAGDGCEASQIEQLVGASNQWQTGTPQVTGSMVNGQNGPPGIGGEWLQDHTTKPVHAPN